MESTDRRVQAELADQIRELIAGLEKASIAEYVKFLENPTRMLVVNFLNGVARGFGFAVGFSLIAALFLYALGYLAQLNLPVIGTFIAELVQLVQGQLESYAR
ncbi:MAG: hypothetical protein GX058_06965 [Firmicutes bacterium]|nr:hypothetical protein [Bacillota bacterium]